MMRCDNCNRKCKSQFCSKKCRLTKTAPPPVQVEVPGPTLSSPYNAQLARWKELGSDDRPECEECGEDLTGKEVVETPILWLCQGCATKQPGEVQQ